MILSVFVELLWKFCGNQCRDGRNFTVCECGGGGGGGGLEKNFWR